MVRMTQIAEQELAIETLMASKGFSESVVNLTEDSADIVVNAEELTDANRAQIEDIVTRKIGDRTGEYRDHTDPRIKQKIAGSERLW